MFIFSVEDTFSVWHQGGENIHSFQSCNGVRMSDVGITTEVCSTYCVLQTCSYLPSISEPHILWGETNFVSRCWSWQWTLLFSICPGAWSEHCSTTPVPFCQVKGTSKALQNPPGWPCSNPKAPSKQIHCQSCIFDIPSYLLDKILILMSCTKLYFWMFSEAVFDYIDINFICQECCGFLEPF